MKKNKNTYETVTETVTQYAIRNTENGNISSKQKTQT